MEWLVLHRCTRGGEIRQPIPAGESATCQPPGLTCGAPVLPDQPVRTGHAWIVCPSCLAVIGVCGALEVEQLETETAAILQGF